MDYYKKQIKKQARREAFLSLLHVAAIFIFIAGIFWLSALAASIF